MEQTPVHTAFCQAQMVKCEQSCCLPKMIRDKKLTRRGPDGHKVKTVAMSKDCRESSSDRGAIQDWGVDG